MGGSSHEVVAGGAVTGLMSSADQGLGGREACVCVRVCVYVCMCAWMHTHIGSLHIERSMCFKA